MNRDELINNLFNLQDLKYKEFHSKLILDNNLIGVRTFELKKIAKYIAQNDYKEFIKCNKHEFYEENVIHGLILGYLKLDFLSLKPYIDEFLKYINNWAVCDLTVSNLKIFKNNNFKKIGFKEVKKYINNPNPWINRFGYVLILTYYINDDYIDKIFKLCENYKDYYYVKMAIAWLISICYIKYREKTIIFLKNNKLDNWTYNKTIQKIIESNRVSNSDKDILRKMKK